MNNDYQKDSDQDQPLIDSPPVEPVSDPYAVPTQSQPADATYQQPAIEPPLIYVGEHATPDGAPESPPVPADTITAPIEPIYNIDKDEGKFATYEFPSAYSQPAAEVEQQPEPTPQPPTEEPATVSPQSNSATIEPPQEAPTQPDPTEESVLTEITPPEPLIDSALGQSPLEATPSVEIASEQTQAQPTIATEFTAETDKQDWHPVTEVYDPPSSVTPTSQTPQSYVAYTPPPLEPQAGPATPLQNEPTGNDTVPPGQLDRLKQVLKKRSQDFNSKNLRARLKPLASAALVGALIYGVFNSQLLLGQLQYLISPGANAGDGTVDMSQAVTSDPEIVIPKINLKAPVVYDVKTFDEQAVQKALSRGVVHYGTTAVPGQKGNNVIVGHSSNNWWASGKYKFAFVLLNKLEIGDTFFLHYNSKRYTYEIKDKKIVEPNQVNVLNQNIAVPTTTLITCDPPGTSWKRLVVQAEQIDPDPKKSTSAAPSTPKQDITLPGYGQTFVDKIRDLFN